MAHAVRIRPIGILPLVAPAIAIVAGAVIESLHAWYNPDFYQHIWLEGDLETKVALLNNYWQNLWRSGTASGFTRGDAIMTRIDQHMQQWVDWKAQYDEAILRRWVPFVGRDWEEELYRFKDMFDADFYEMLRVGGQRAQDELAARGTQPDAVPINRTTSESISNIVQNSLDSAARAGASATKNVLFWPSVAVVASAGAMIWLLARAAAPR